MRLYKISKQRWAGKATLTGEGARTSHGRWHQLGDRVIYTASCEALAALESLVHTRIRPKIPRMLTVMELDDDVSSHKVALNELPSNWHCSPAGEPTKRWGSDWLNSQESLVLRVPSALLRYNNEHNVLINPNHPDCAKVTVAEVVPFVYDDRFFAETH